MPIWLLDGVRARERTRDSMSAGSARIGGIINIQDDDDDDDDYVGQARAID